VGAPEATALSARPVDDRRGARAVAGLAAAGFAVAVTVLVTATLALVSVLDAQRAQRAAEQIAMSRFTADVIAQTVQQAVEPVAGAAVADQLATATAADPRVQGVVEAALVNTHRRVVDADPVEASTTTANLLVDQAIVRSVTDAATQAGLDLVATGLPTDVGAVEIGGVPLAQVVTDADLPTVVPDDVPELALRTVAETARVVAAFAATGFALLAVFAHPRPGRAMRGLGAILGVVCGGWLVGLLVGGWVIGLTTETLFGEMIDAIWSEAVSTMLVMTGAGVLIGGGVWLAGTAFDGFDRSRRA
jgi:hypothetical protein